MVCARLQARKLILDVQDYTPATATIYLVLSCVTINRSDRDSEILCGHYTADSRLENQSVTYYGLGDHPASYRLDFSHRSLLISDPNVGVEELR